MVPCTVHTGEHTAPGPYWYKCHYWTKHYGSMYREYWWTHSTRPLLISKSLLNQAQWFHDCEYWWTHSTRHICIIVNTEPNTMVPRTVTHWWTNSTRDWMLVTTESSTMVPRKVTGEHTAPDPYRINITTEPTLRFLVLWILVNTQHQTNTYTI